jgi:hypothetical protein
MITERQFLSATHRIEKRIVNEFCKVRTLHRARILARAWVQVGGKLDRARLRYSLNDAQLGSWNALREHFRREIDSHVGMFEVLFNDVKGVGTQK